MPGARSQEPDHGAGSAVGGPPAQPELPEGSPLGTYAHDLGAVRVHWLDGGAFRPDGGVMFGPVPRRFWERLHPVDAQNLIRLATRPLLVQTSAGWLVVDGGFGHHLPDKQQRIYNVEHGEQIQASLAHWGISRADVRWVVMTHLHLDHASGLVRTGQDGRLEPWFPNARHVVQKREVEQISRPHERVRHAYDHPGWHVLLEAGLIDQVDGRREIVPGVEVFLTGGHSRGHQGVRFQKDGTTLLHLGDVLPTSAHLRPLWVSALDDYPLECIEAKRHWLGQAAEAGWWVLFYHDDRVLAGRCSEDYDLVEAVEAGARALS